jgi:hypothetical protein
MFPRFCKSLAFCFAIILCVVPEQIHAQSTLIPLTARRGMIFDHGGHYLYISTSNGFVQRYNLATKQVDNSYQLGGSLNGIDIAPDDSFLLVGQDGLTSGQGTFHRIDLSNGFVTNIHYTPDMQEIGGWDVAICSNGLAFVTTQFDGSGFVRVRQIDLSTNSISVRTDVSGGYVTQNTIMHRSADGTLIYFLEPNNSGGPLFIYNASTNTFGATAQTSRYLDGTGAAVSRDGSFLATNLDGYTSLDAASNFGLITSFSGLDSGLAFDSKQDLLYGVNSSTAQIIAYDTNSFAELYRLNIGEQAVPFVEPFNQGELAASPDGHYLALETPAGIRLFDLPQGSPTPMPTPAPRLTSVRDFVFDSTSAYLYIGSDTGLVWRYALSSQTLESRYDVRGVLNGIDIAPNDSFLLIAQAHIGLTEGALEKLNLGTGVAYHFTYPLVFTEDGGWDVAITSNGLAVLTTSLPPHWSGSLPVRALDLSNGSFPVRYYMLGSTRTRRSADRTRLLFLEPNNTSGNALSYSAVTDSFGPTFGTDITLDGAGGAVSRDGSLAAIGSGGAAKLYSLPNFSVAQILSGMKSGVAFNAVNDTLYAVDTAAGQIIAYDTLTYAEDFRINVGESMSVGISQFGIGDMRASQDGRYLALHTPTALRVIDVQTQSQQIIPISSPPPPIPTPTPNTYMVATGSIPHDGGTVSGGGTHTAGSSVTLTAIPASGWQLANWSGDASGSSNPLTLTVDSDKNILANFAPTLPTVVIPQISPGGGVFKKKVVVKLSCATTGAAIHYTLDGSDPTASSATYSTSKKFKGLTITGKGPHTVKTIGTKFGFSDSSIATANFTIN